MTSVEDPPDDRNGYGEPRGVSSVSVGNLELSGTERDKWETTEGLVTLISV